MLKALLLICVIGATTSVPLQDDVTQRRGETCGYESCTKTEADILNVHIVPHTHDDVGWLKTVDQYYYGSRNNIQKAGVQYILDSVVKELWEDSRRRFIYVETAFFWKWWVRQSDSVRHKVHTLVRQGRLQFVGGAWSMNDEAASHYQSTIDQFTWGLSKLNDTFGRCGLPRVGWQIDPFGHSREFASLLAGMGYDGLFLGRIDYQDKNTRRMHETMEMLWRGDDDLGKSSDIFTGVLYNTYSPPPGFCFDVLCNDEPIIDDPASPMYNVDDRISSFMRFARVQSTYYRSNNVIITMGGDFTYQDATMWYNNLDKLILHANLKAAKEGLKIKLFYSTPDCYLKAVKDANPTLPRKQDDFFPYASDPTAYWTGYFTSRPTTKYFEREGNNYLQMVKQLQVLANLEEHNMFVLNELKSAMGVMQHHDAVTGTEKEHVTHDYERMLHQAIEDSLIIARQAFNKLMQTDARQPPTLSFQRCHFNESKCEVSENSNKFVVNVYNPLGWTVKEPIRIPVVQNEYEIFTGAGNILPSQLVEIPNYVSRIPTRKSKATHEIVFIDDIPALGFKSYYIQAKQKVKRENKYKHATYFSDINDYWKGIRENPNNVKIVDDITYVDAKIPDRPVHNQLNDRNFEDEDLNADILKDKAFEVRTERKNRRVELNYHNLNEDEMRMLADDPMVVQRYDDLFLENEHLKLLVDRPSGQITHAVFPDGSALNLSIKYYYYPGCAGNNMHPSNRSSGAYIFRPNATKPIDVPYGNSSLINGHIVKELRNDMGNVASTNRLYTGLEYLENEWVIGPINIDDNVGKEYIVKYITDIINNGEFYTDSNGRQVLKRKLNQRPQWNVTLEEPVPGNYYPVTNEIFIEDSKVGLAVITDRSQGGTSLIEGNIELMLHRRLLHDDAFGVDEALNETADGKGLVVRGRHRLILTSDENKRRQHAINLQLQPLVLVSDAKDLSLDVWAKYKNEYTGINDILPKGIHLLTLEPWRGKFLLRLENYQTKSEPIAVDLKKIFKKLKIKSYRETTLAANQWIDDYEKWTWSKDGEFARSFNEEYGNFNEVPRAEDKDDVRDEADLVKIKSKQIRTFIVDYDYQ